MKRPKARVARTAQPAARVPHTPVPSPGALKIPPILLEGDRPDPPRVEGKARKSSTPAAVSGPAERRELPESYGTSKLLLLPRDPFCLYAHWDLSLEQRRRLNERSAAGHLVLRLHQGQVDGPVVAEIQLPPEPRHQFVPVGTAGANYVAELGYEDFNHLWVSIATSRPAATPTATVSSDKTARFAMIPGARRETDPERTRPIAPPRVSWIPVLGQNAASPATEFLENTDSTGSNLSAAVEEEWTLEEQQALNALSGSDTLEWISLSSLELPRAICSLRECRAEFRKR